LKAHEKEREEKKVTRRTNNNNNNNEQNISKYIDCRCRGSTACGCSHILSGIYESFRKPTIRNKDIPINQQQKE
jgi:hypothetical protein